MRETGEVVNMYTHTHVCKVKVGLLGFVSGGKEMKTAGRDRLGMVIKEKMLSLHCIGGKE